MNTIILEHGHTLGNRLSALGFDTIHRVETFALTARIEVVPTHQAKFDAWSRLVSLADGGDSSLVQENRYDGHGYPICMVFPMTHSSLDQF